MDRIGLTQGWDKWLCCKESEDFTSTIKCGDFVHWETFSFSTITVLNGADRQAVIETGGKKPIWCLEPCELQIGALFEEHPVVLKLWTGCESFRRMTSSRRRRAVGWSSPETELAWDKTKEVARHS
jgi:hypothetical protein